MCADTGTAAHRAQTISRHHYPSSPLLSPVQQPHRAPEGERGGGTGSLALFLSFFHFLPPCFCNLSSVASPSLSLVTSERQAGGLLPVCPPVCLPACLWWERSLCHAALFFIQLDKNRGRRLWIRHAHDSFCSTAKKGCDYFFPLAQLKIPDGNLSVLCWFSWLHSGVDDKRCV